MPGWSIVSWQPSPIVLDDEDYTPPLCLCCRRGCPANDGPAEVLAMILPAQLCRSCYQRGHDRGSEAE